METIKQLFAHISAFQQGSSWGTLLLLSGLFWGILWIAFKFTRDQLPQQIVDRFEHLGLQSKKASAQVKRIEFLEQKIKELEEENTELKKKL